MRPRTLFLILLLIELTSYTAYFFPILNTVGFFVIVVAALILSMRRLEYGLCFVLADLILGGKSGALFSFEYGGFFLSLRMALFIVVMAVWGGKVVSAWVRNPSQPPLNLRGGDRKVPSLRLRGGVLWWWMAFGLAVVWGIVVGLVRGNDFGNLFLDANGYFYGALVLPFVWVFRRETNSELNPNITNYEFNIRNIRIHSPFGSLGVVFFAATTLLALKTLFSVYVFTHGLNNFIAANLFPYFRWIRDTGVGEITSLPGNFARVFFQSHIYNVAAFFVLLGENMGRLGLRSNGGRASLYRFALLIINAAVIIVSLSRSFWVGVVVGLLVLVLALVGSHNPSWPPLILRGGTALIAAIVLLLVVARFPLPRPSAVDLRESIEERANITTQAGAASRWNLLPEMWSAVREHPIIGSGFGRTVTYISNDPRIREVNPTGEYTTYAFEWGWLDFWLKLGLIGLIGPIGLIGRIAYALWQRIRSDPTALATLAVLAVLAATHFFTPYLNHPLGIGILILGTIIGLRDDLSIPQTHAIVVP